VVSPETSVALAVVQTAHVLLPPSSEVVSAAVTVLDPIAATAESDDVVSEAPVVREASENLAMSRGTDEDSSAVVVGLLSSEVAVVM